MKEVIVPHVVQSPRLPLVEDRWNNRALSSSERFTAYRDYLHQLGTELSEVIRKESSPHARQHIAQDVGIDAVWQEYERITSHTYSEHTFVQEQDSKLFAPLLGERFLGAEAWRSASAVDVGVVPPVPHTLTPEILNSPSPLHPGRKIGESHFLTLIPARLKDRPLSLVELIVTCGRDPHSEGTIVWNEHVVLDELRTLAVGHAAVPESRWALVAESDPAASDVSPERLLRGRDVAGQEEVLRTFYPEYQFAHPLDMMATIFLNRIVNGKRILHDLIQRCEKVGGGAEKHCCVGPYRGGLIVIPQGRPDEKFFLLGAALKRRL